MMQILNAGGIPVLTDNLRKPDINNPKGYFEYEKVKTLPVNSTWLNEAEGKAVKVIVQLISYLPLNFNFSVIMMERSIDEITLSQEKMIDNLGGKQSFVGKDILKKTFKLQLAKARKYLSANNNFKTFTINYNELLSGTTEVLNNMSSELELNLNLDNIDKIIDKSLYRNRVS